MLEVMYYANAAASAAIAGVMLICNAAIIAAAFTATATFDSIGPLIARVHAMRHGDGLPGHG